MSDLAHSKFSASAADRWMSCPGSMVLCANQPNTSSSYADWGTDAHTLAALCLTEGRNAEAYTGRILEMGNEVDDEMIDVVQTYVDYVRDVVGDDGVLVVEERVNYSSYLGVEHYQAWGTADAIVFKGDEIHVIDLKTGRGVEVSAEDNRQMKLYALGALQAYHGVVADFERVRMSISQPRVKKAPSEWDCSVQEIVEWAQGEAVEAANMCELAHASDDAEWAERFLRPTEKGCRWCSAKATCPALRNEVALTVFDAQPATPEEFADLGLPYKKYDGTEAEWIAAALAKCDMIEDFTKAIRAEAERRLLSGEPVPGFKVVQGKRGARQWADAKAAEEALKAFRLKQEQMYDFKLISPTTAEKLAKAEEIGPRQWTKLQELIVQKEGAPHVAPASDPRPALEIKPVADDFETLA